MTTVTRINVLIDSGDWACSWGYWNELASVCQEVTPLVDPALARWAMRIATLSRSDQARASREWRGLSRELRQDLRAAAQPSA